MMLNGILSMEFGSAVSAGKTLRSARFVRRNASAANAMESTKNNAIIIMWRVLVTSAVSALSGGSYILEPTDVPYKRFRWVM